jgi:hypothetical protein
MTNEKNMPATQKPDAKPDAPPTVEQFGHKHPNVGPTTNRVLADWNQFRDYENFNPTAEK